ncbi:MAG: 50S ribosomal protein L10 [Candidatus Magasanikbacteria bacterium CG10_big_fil_rev_8_21_14_0_10_40_10]|uniref:Large ribosomal subunit protein uL10 n=1 Tax=Candidatus Magasanikbacteria bacterium CG10_big_fil_rev_8_21_14_0_10_40_10 TaxID=1974648 RepID=A0A2M6W300_9BACT|nr:MAG: 50S ribosomal protein L10 [Candidatus Magasanikbacteria bacterium CG10_big_fil_rev_8_21_14_0_10_40_10]
MPKNLQQKQDSVSSLAQSLKAGKGAVFANFQGLKVSESQELRKSSRSEGVEMLAAKKTLVKLACQQAGLQDVDPTEFNGAIATFISANDEVSAARVVNRFAKDHELVKIFGGILEGKFITSDEVKNLANLPNRTELLAKLVGTLNAPVSGFVNVLAGNLRALVSVLNNIKEAKV